MLRYLPFLLVLALWIYAFIDCLNTPESQVRRLPKVVWVIIILLFGEVLVGPVAWLAAGKVRGPRPDGSAPFAGRSGRRTQWVAPDDNPEFLKSLKDESAPAKDAADAKDAKGAESAEDSARLKDWEADLRRREEELRRKENGPEDTPPPAKG
ncbi:PLD nuclease N-terminal domain-containing protein [Streptomyces celluloflavus]|uniref:PLD nuclease N-terminal domain-containing protein n=1 Tax=Streptomyces celluloflavus TaxID=58344 RepID=UPI0036626EE5